MTRINADLDPQYLTDQVLMAEYRELPMVYASLRRSLNAVNGDVNKLKKKIPQQFTLNKGHVTFFYDKLGFLSARYQRLINELTARGYDLDKTRQYSISEFDIQLCNSYQMTSVDKQVIVDRLLVRFDKRAGWYKFKRKEITKNEFVSNLALA